MGAAAGSPENPAHGVTRLLMSADRTAPDPAAALERELLARLGLGPDAGAEEIEAAHASVVAYLAAAPNGARRWAREQAAAADEAYALLSDPTALQERAARSYAAPGPARQGTDAAAATSAPAAAVEADPEQDPPPSPRPGPATSGSKGKAGARATGKSARGRTTAGSATSTEASEDDLLDDLIAEVTPSAHRDEVRRSVRQSRPHNGAARSGRRFAPGRMLAVAAAVAGVAAIVFVVSGFANSSIPGAPGPVESQAVEATLDESAVAGLMERIQADPGDTDALMQLGNAFFSAGQYEVSAQWLAKLVALEPDNVQALLALGAAQFNSGNVTDAEVAWTNVVELDPENVEAHYDLGFLYLQQDPPDVDGMQREWQTVVQLAPGTTVAESVQAHLSAITSAQPAASTEPTSSADPSPAPSVGAP
jgi:cytochrome c-type biogenesis protein CcmH/NrfG